jgi:hypothetical protein
VNQFINTIVAIQGERDSFVIVFFSLSFVLTINLKKNKKKAEPCRPMAGAPELGQLLISLRHEQEQESAAGRPSSSRRLKVLIHRAHGLPPTKTVVYF